MMPRLVLFDIDGTLLDAGGAGRRSLERACKERFGRDDLTRGIAFGGRLDPDIVDQILRRQGADLEQRNDLLARYVEILHEELRGSRSRVLPGARRVLDTLAGQPQVTLGLVTGNVREGARAKLQSVGLWGFFPVGAFGDEARTRADLVSLARQRAEALRSQAFRSQHVFHVGDTVNDVLAARDSGTISVAVASGIHGHEQLLPSEPRHLLESLAPAQGLLDVVLA